MTATHWCVKCFTKTTHTSVVGQVALRCVVCGNIVPIEIKKPEEQP